MAHTPITIELNKPVNYYGDMIEQIVLSPPKGIDILHCGYPWSTGVDPRTGSRIETIHMPALRGLLSRMAQIPESTVDALDAVDIYRATEAMKFFFHYRTPATSSKSSPAPDDGGQIKGSSGT